MYLVVRTTKSHTGGTVQNISGIATEEALEEYILRHGIENCEVYKAEKLQFSVSWQKKATKEYENVLSSKED